MVSVEAKNGSVLLTFQGRRGPTQNSLSVKEAEELVADLEEAIGEARAE